MLRERTVSDFVGLEVRALRKRRNWTQQQLVDRLDELGIRGWTQAKVAKLEKGRIKRVLVDDVFELALALDVSPIYLLTPTFADKGDDVFKVWLGGGVSHWPQTVRDWIRGERAVLGLVDYKTVDEAKTGHRFYFFDGRPMGDWRFPEQNQEVAQLVRDMQVPNEEEE
jgi:hypothetical protein